MNYERLSALIVRLSGLSWTVSGLLNLTYLPRYLFDLNVARPGSAAKQLYTGEVNMTIIRALIDVVCGTILFVSWRRIADLLTHDCSKAAVSQTDLEGDTD